MAYQPTRSKGTGKAGSKSSRYQKRAPAKKAASKTRHVEDKVETSFDQYVARRMKDPNFAREFRKAVRKLEALRKR